MLEKIKQKFISSSKRGITFSDKNLFAVGTKFKYIINNNKILIVKEDEFEKVAADLNIQQTTNVHNGTVSKKSLKEIPLVDIRRKEATKVFGTNDTLVVDIFEDYVVVTGYEEAAESKSVSSKIMKSVSKLSDKILNKFSKNDKVVNLQELKLRQKFQMRFLKKQLASGEQLHFDLFAEVENQINQDESIGAEFASSIKQAFEDAAIPLQIASFFSGSGIFDEGFRQAGFDIVFALEKNEAAARTYTYNHGDHMLCGDIRTFDKSLVRGIPVFVGGPPCQGFSNSNRHTNYLENENNSLVLEYINTIKSNPECKVFVLENVPQILTAGDGLFKDEILNQLDDFEISYGIMNSADFGCAQARRRAIFIGSKIGKIEIPEPILEPCEYVTVGEALEGIEEHAPNQQDYSKPKPDTVEKMSFVGQGENWEAIPLEYRNERMMSGKTHSNVYRRLEEDKPSITITNPRKSNILHPTLNRILSVRECARLFGLRDDFVFLGNLGEKQQQGANGVPVQIGYFLGNGIKKAIEIFNFSKGFLKPYLV